MSALELIIVLILAAIVISATVVVFQPVLGRESARGALYEIEGMARLARVEAASRNRDCRLLLNTETRRLLVVDTMGTAPTADDVALRRATLPSGVQFRTPDASPAVTLQALGGSWFGATFDSSGTVAVGAGSVVVQGQDRHSRLTVFAAGGTEATNWNGSEWSQAKY